MSMAPRRSSGAAYPAVPRASSPSNGDSSQGGDGGEDSEQAESIVPIPIVLNWNTIIKLAAPAVVTLVMAIAAGGIFWSNTRTHLKDTARHISPADRQQLETKSSAKVARSRMIKALKKNTALRVREIKVEQREQIQKLGAELKTDQRRILREVQRTRRAIR